MRHVVLDRVVATMEEAESIRRSLIEFGLKLDFYMRTRWHRNDQGELVSVVHLTAQPTACKDCPK